MDNLVFTIIFTVVVVGLFVLAISLTLIFKGHNIDSEIATNKNMQKLGIKCTAEQFAKEQGCSTQSLCGKSTCEDCKELKDK